MSDREVAWLEKVIHYVTTRHETEGNWSNIDDNETLIYDFGRPHLRPSLRVIFPFLLIFYGLIICGGIGANGVMLANIIKRNKYRKNDATEWLLANGAFSDIIKSVLVLPLSLTTLLLENWIFGKALCFALPMLQDMSLYASTLTFLFLAAVRFRRLVHPMKRPLPVFLAILISWVVPLIFVLPYMFFISYVDLKEHFGPRFPGVCFADAILEMQEYVRATFIIMYVLPLAISAYLHVRVSADLKNREHLQQQGHQEQVEPSTVCLNQIHRPSQDNNGDSEVDKRRVSGTTSTAEYEEEEVEEIQELDVLHEKLAQKYIVTMVTVYGLCLCPLMILKVLRQVLVETYDNTGHFDITYILCVWLAFAPVCTTPAFYAAWRMSRERKTRLRNVCFRLVCFFTFRESSASGRRGDRRSSAIALATALHLNNPKQNRTRRSTDESA